MSSNHNYYEVLEIHPHASQSEIQNAYQKARATYSLSNPEIYQIFSEQEAIAWVQLIEEAFIVLGNPQNRETYNRSLEEHSRVVAPDLPNFSLETPTHDNETEVQAQPSQPVEQNVASEATPEKPIEPAAMPITSQGKTCLSTYSINPGVEEAIDRQDLFDGLFLKKIRMYKGVDLQDLSHKTCIALRHLYAIENNNFSVLPAPVFVRGYIQQYCRILHLNEPKVVKSFMSLLANESQVSL